MKKKKLYIRIVLLIFIVVLAVGLTCQECVAWWAGTARVVGVETQKALETVKGEPAEKEREVTWVDKEGNPIDEKKETGSSQSEDVDDLDKYVEGSVSLKGKVSSPIPGMLELNIDWETNTVEGSIKGMGWTEEVITGDDGDGSEDHHHTKNCEVIFNGTFFGTIDANGIIFANVVGYKNGKDGDCKLLVKDKPESFTLSGNYRKNFNNAIGEIKPQRYSWSADKV